MWPAGFDRCPRVPVLWLSGRRATHGARSPRRAYGYGSEKPAGRSAPVLVAVFLALVFFLARRATHHRVDSARLSGAACLSRKDHAGAGGFFPILPPTP